MFRRIYRALVARIAPTRLARAVIRYTRARGTVLAGGISYSALFSLGAALALCWTGFSFVLGSNPEFREKFVAAVNRIIPGVLASPSHPRGLISTDVLTLETGLSATSLIAFLILIWAAISMMTALRHSIRAIGGLPVQAQNFAVGKALDLAGFVILAVGTFASSILTAGATKLARPLLDLLLIEGKPALILVRITSFAAGFLVDAAVLGFLFVVVARLRVPARDMLIGLATGALGFSLIRLVGTSAVASVAANPLLAPFAALITILLWINLVARITLIAAAVAANIPIDEVVEDDGVAPQPLPSKGES